MLMLAFPLPDPFTVLKRKLLGTKILNSGETAMEWLLFVVVPAGTVDLQ